MTITMTRYKRSELEQAIKEKESQGWVCVGNGIVPLHDEIKVWNYDDGRISGYGGRSVSNKFIVKMRKVESA